MTKIKFDPILGRVREDDKLYVEADFGGKAVVATDPGTPTAAIFYICTETGTYTNFDNQAADVLDRFYWNTTTSAWDLIPYEQSYIQFVNTDPDGVGTPASGKVFVGTYQDRIWIKKSSGVIQYLAAAEDFNWYGVEWDVTVSSPDCTRIGNMSLHASLPVHNKIYACLLNDDGTENYKLNPTDWSKKLTGGDSDLTGADGQVMICFPAHYFKSEVEGDTRRLKVSEYSLDGYTYVAQQYISAYEAALNRTDSKLASVKNATATYRGGNNDATNDANDATLLGMPATLISRTNFRTYARARGAGWQMYNYNAHNILTYFFVIEYATRNSQKAVNASLDASGYKQGGLGDGVTNIDSGLWNTWKSYYPFITCGTSDSLGTGSGEVDYEMPAGYGAVLTTHVNRYRGIEMPFGHINKNADGINVRIGADSDGDPTSKVYVSNDVSKWNDTVYTDMSLLAQLPRANGYIAEMVAGGIVPIATGGGSTTYWCDYLYTSLPASG